VYSWRARASQSRRWFSPTGTNAVLKREFSYLGIGSPGTRALGMFAIGRPDLDWVRLAKGMGVPDTRVISLAEFVQALRWGFARGSPLIEVPL
jgi:acetolactate synthase I/II/III large subunit